MTNIHFAYTVYNHEGYQTPQAWRNLPIDQLAWPSPVHAPFSITYFLLKAFSQKFSTKLYDLRENVTADLGAEDIFFGHLFPKAGGYGNTSVVADEDTVTWRTLKEYKNSGRTCILQPFVYSPDVLQAQWAYPAFLEYSDSFIAICGKYWEDSWKLSPLSKNNKRFLRINMCIDSTGYPFVRKKFQPKGQRKFLYIGHTSGYKNTSQLEAIAQQMPGFQGLHIGSGEIKGWTKISDFAPLTPELLTILADNVDVFLSTSTADAQATTILEQMAAGFAIACTPQSGYQHPSIIELHPTDTEFNCHQLHKLQNMEEDQLMAMATKNRELIEQEYCWEHAGNQIIEFAKTMLL